MNPYQEKFYQFIMANVLGDKQEDAKALLQESFAKQNDKTFNMEYLMHFQATIKNYLKPEKVEEVVNVMKNFQSQMK